MKRIMMMFLLLAVGACAAVSVAPITKPNYTGRDFTQANPNAGFPVVVCEQCGEGAVGADK